MLRHTEPKGYREEIECPVCDGRMAVEFLIWSDGTVAVECEDTRDACDHLVPEEEREELLARLRDDDAWHLAVEAERDAYGDYLYDRMVEG